MPSPNFYKSNLAAAEISSAIGISDTTITITPAEAAIFPTAPFHATIMPPSGTPNMLNSEIVEVSAVNTTTGTLTVVRAQRGTTAKAFSVNAVIMVGVYSEDAVFLSTDGTPEPTSPWIQSSDIQTDAVTWEKAAFQKYSTSETIVGTWIDGKPIYRVVFVKTFPSLSTGDNVWAHNIANISEITNIRTTFNLGWDTNTWGAGDYLAGSGYQIRVNKTNFILNNTTSATNWRGTIKSVVEYTKTTD